MPWFSCCCGSDSTSESDSQSESDSTSDSFSESQSDSNSNSDSNSDSNSTSDSTSDSTSTSTSDSDSSGSGGSEPPNTCGTCARTWTGFSWSLSSQCSGRGTVTAPYSCDCPVPAGGGGFPGEIRIMDCNLLGV